MSPPSVPASPPTSTPAPPAAGAGSEGFDPAQSYPESTVYGVYQRGAIQGAEPGFLFRYVFGFSSMSGSLDEVPGDIAIISPLEVNLSMGHRFDLSRTRTLPGRMSLTVEGEVGVIPIGLMVVEWPDSTDSDLSPITQGDGVVLPAVTFGPAASFEVALHSHWGLFARPTFAVVVGGGMDQDFEGYLEDTSYSATMFGLQIGVMRYSFKRHFTMGMGFRTISYDLETNYGSDGLGTTGFFFNIGSTG